jgi:hypothetical protein
MSYQVRFGESEHVVNITCKLAEFVDELKALALECRNVWPASMHSNILDFLQCFTDADKDKRADIICDLKYRLHNPTASKTLKFFDEVLDGGLLISAYAPECPPVDVAAHYLAEIRPSSTHVISPETPFFESL